MLSRSIDSLPDERVSHNPRVTKRVLLRNGEVPQITQFSRASFPPNEFCGVHTHHDMWEMFLVESGFGVAVVNSTNLALSPGTCLVVEPGEVHEIQNSSPTELVVLTFSWKATA